MSGERYRLRSPELLVIVCEVHEYELLQKRNTIKVQNIYLAKTGSQNSQDIYIHIIQDITCI